MSPKANTNRSTTSNTRKQKSGAQKRREKAARLAAATAAPSAADDVTHALADVFPAGPSTDDATLAAVEAVIDDAARRLIEKTADAPSTTDTTPAAPLPSLDAIATADANAAAEKAARKYDVHPALIDVTPTRWQQRFMYRANRIINRAAERGEVMTLDAAIAKATRGSDIARNQKPASLLAFLASVGETVKSGDAPTRQRGAERAPSGDAPSTDTTPAPSTNGNGKSAPQVKAENAGTLPSNRPVAEYLAKMVDRRDGDLSRVRVDLEKRRAASLASGYNAAVGYYDAALLLLAEQETPAETVAE